MDIAMNMISNGTMPTAEVLEAAGLNFTDATIMMETAQRMMAQGGGGSGGNGGGNNYYYLDGAYYKKNPDNTYTEVDASKINENDKFNFDLDDLNKKNQDYLKAKEEHDKKNKSK